MTTAPPAIPAAAVAIIAAALEDHRLTVDPLTDTPRAAAEDIALYLASFGYALVPASTWFPGSEKPQRKPNTED